MLHAGLDLSRRKVDVCLLSGASEIVDEWASPPDADGLLGLAARAAMYGPAVRGVIESMNGARFVHDRLEEHGWRSLQPPSPLAGGRQTSRSSRSPRRRRRARSSCLVCQGRTATTRRFICTR
jgi:hypothetical protein